MKLWQGRLEGDVDERLNRLNQSIGFDARMYKQDITGSIAHARMLGKTGVITGEEMEAIVTGLQGILADLDSGALEIDMTCEDIHTFVEAELTKRIGQPGKKLHTARSRNDQVALDLRLYLADEIEATRARCTEVIKTLCNVAEKHLHTVMPGYTHLQRAQPVTLAHHLMAYAQMLLRDRERLAECRARTLVSPLGSGALAGSGYPLDRQYVAEQLGMNGVSENSLDAVADRDFVLELLSDFSILMAHLSRFAEEICLWCSWEFRFMALDDRFSTGSSIMPQKKNPDLAELIRGKTGRVYGALTTLLTAVKGLPLAYNKDLQEDKEAVFDALDTVNLCLDVLPPMLESATFFPERMRAAAAAGFLNATDCADYLVSKGVPFRDAYAISGQLVRLCVEKGETLDTLPLEEYRKLHAAFDEDVYAFIDLNNCVAKRKVYGGPAPEAVQAQIANVHRQCR
ncbi:MAG TPA: argininosuccinate lyase [Candidatus Pullichristensenella stercorigallinarum]|uniref:Argininosuccinate lyase n=1 Tax=Candidatus Pullichristensenella stercorigallinarum TaxID=2840909 RepID=A0A9D1CVH9_9FIRM|nr:argininosuccinate lyase [Candidatus Pullichristensenella stercorigallinarum]